MAPTIGRATLPSEFYDAVSKVVASTPLPEWTYARMIYAASMQAQIMRMGPENVRGIFRQDMGASSGMPYPDLSLMQMIINKDPLAAFSEAIMVSDELATGQGHTLKIPRPVYTGGGYSFAARRIGPSQKISETPITITDENISITIERHSGPFAAGGTEPQPVSVSEADMKRSIHSVIDRVSNTLQYDRNALLDAGIASLFDNWELVIYPGDPNGLLNSSGTAGDAAALPTAGSRPFSLEVIKRAETRLIQRNIRRFSDGTYKCIITAKQAEQLALDPLFVRLSAYINEKNPLVSQSIGRVGNVDIYVSNSNAVDTTTVGGVSIQHGVVFGPGSVGYAHTAEPAHTRQAGSTNYDQQALLIWVCDEGASQLDNRFGVGIHSN